MARHAAAPVVQLGASYPPAVRVSLHLSKLEAALWHRPRLTTVRGFMELDTTELPAVHGRVATAVMPAVSA